MANNFIGGSYELKRRKADVQRSINLMPTPIESGSGKSAMYLAPAPGLKVFSTVDGTPANEDYSYSGQGIERFTGTTTRAPHVLVFDDFHTV